MSKQLIQMEIRQDKVEILLAALKSAELRYSEQGKWQASHEVNKLNSFLREYIYGYEIVD